MILLDTNALLWLLHADGRLGAEARKAIDAATVVYQSSASSSELMIKHMLGRLALPGGDRFPTVFSDAGLRELPFTSAHVVAMLRFPALTRHDPFDRMILAQADAERLTLLTADATLLALGETWIQDARI
ncbi:MAG: type II toxin-antitoxin system VapC family toxin [Actinobacteria bacterium]|nr:type II toxin-antitoxin system VapC family toxin [Actinomycetota bacterium]